MKKLWKSQKSSGAKLTVSITLVIAILLTMIYCTNYESQIDMTVILIFIGYFFGTSICLFGQHLYPILRTEHVTSKELKDSGYILAEDQNVRVVFHPNGLLDEIFYQDTSYRNNPKYKEFYTIHSDPAYLNPQHHTVQIKQFPSESLLIVTERLRGGQIFTTVYKPVTSK